MNICVEPLRLDVGKPVNVHEPIEVREPVGDSERVEVADPCAGLAQQARGSVSSADRSETGSVQGEDVTPRVAGAADAASPIGGGGDLVEASVEESVEGPVEASVAGLGEGLVVVRVDGDVDLYTGPELQEVLADLLAPVGRDRPHGPRQQALGAGSALRGVILDLRDVVFIDSYALGVVVGALKLARSGGYGLAVVATSELIRSLFRLTGVSQLLPLHPDVSSAVTTLLEPPS